MTTQFSNIQITATSTTQNEQQGFTVEVKGLDNKLNCKRTFTDPLKAMRYMFMLQKRLNLQINKMDLTAVSLAYQKAKEEMEKAKAAMEVVASQAQKDADDIKEEELPHMEIVYDGKNGPLMKQFHDLKRKHPDALLLFRCGDFYETYLEDAKDASEILGITLTKKGRVEMAGFPAHALDSYLPKLIRAGKRVAICDQITNTEGALL